MAESIKDKIVDAGKTVVDAAKRVGQAVSNEAGQAADFVAEKTGWAEAKEGASAGVAGIRDRMDVIASCGKKVGVVDHLEGGAIKLTKNDSADGQHHFIPTDWVDHVDSHVHLNRNSKQAVEGWKSDASTCGCG